MENTNSKIQIVEWSFFLDPRPPYLELELELASYMVFKEPPKRHGGTGDGYGSEAKQVRWRPPTSVPLPHFTLQLAKSCSGRDWGTYERRKTPSHLHVPQSATGPVP